MKTIKKMCGYRLVVVFVCTAYLATFCVGVPIAKAQGLFELPSPGTMVPLSAPFSPTNLSGIKVNPQDPFSVDFILYSEDLDPKDESFSDEASKLIKYFLAALTTPEQDMWVNLSPYEAERIIPDEFARTEMGRDLLSQDYILKQLTASVLHPKEQLGEEFWQEVYQKIYERYGVTDLALNTFNKVWVVTDKAVVHENSETHSAFIVESHLKVMLEEDYLALKESQGQASSNNDDIENNELAKGQGIASEAIREIVLPVIEREVNEGKNFAPLKQMYHAMILATWYKMRLKGSILGTQYIDQKMTEGIELDDPRMKERIYAQYLAAFKQGVYDFIEEEYDPVSQQIIPRKYFSGGVVNRTAENTTFIEAPVDASMLGSAGDYFRVAVSLDVYKKYLSNMMLGLIMCGAGGGCALNHTVQRIEPIKQWQPTSDFSVQRTRMQQENLRQWLVFLENLRAVDSARSASEIIDELLKNTDELGKSDPQWSLAFHRFAQSIRSASMEYRKLSEELAKKKANDLNSEDFAKAGRIQEIDWLVLIPAIMELNETLQNKGWLIYFDSKGQEERFEVVTLDKLIMSTINYGDRPDALSNKLTIPNFFGAGYDLVNNKIRLMKGGKVAVTFLNGVIFFDGEALRQRADWIDEIADPSSKLARVLNEYTPWMREQFILSFKKDGFMDAEGKITNADYLDKLLANLRKHEAAHAVNLRLGKKETSVSESEGYAYSAELLEGMTFSRFTDIVFEGYLEMQRLNSILREASRSRSFSKTNIKDAADNLVKASTFQLFLRKVAEHSGRPDILQSLENLEEKGVRALLEYFVARTAEESRAILIKVNEDFRVKVGAPYWQISEKAGNEPVWPKFPVKGAQGTDQSMTTEIEEEGPVGGIDFNPQNLKLQIEGSTIDFQFDQQLESVADFDVLTPHIVNIISIPLPQVPLFLSHPE